MSSLLHPSVLFTVARNVAGVSVGCGAIESCGTDIVNAFVRHDYRLSGGVPGVAPVSEETAAQIERYIKNYGATLIHLLKEIWNPSVCIWMGDRWDALIDLWTAEEGAGDLVLQVHMSETSDGFVMTVYMVYVP